MKFTKKQFNQMGPMYFDDLCFDLTKSSIRLQIFNQLPSHLQGLAVSWGCDDTEFRNMVFEFLVDNQFGMTVKEYYESDIFNYFIKKDYYQDFDMDKLEPKKFEIDIETKGGIFITPKLHGVGKYNPDKGRYDEKIKNLINKHNKDA